MMIYRENMEKIIFENIILSNNGNNLAWIYVIDVETCDKTTESEL